MDDPYDNGTPKYSTAQEIYDALCELTQTEEMNILSEIGIDVSWEGQTYYYTNKGDTLKEKFEELSDYGNKMWLIDLSIAQLDQKEIHDLVYAAITDPDLAKRIGFKKLFVERMLNGKGDWYDKVIELYESELHELDCFDNYEMIEAFRRAVEANETPYYGASPYPNFAYYLSEKVSKLQLAEETKLILECRSHLTAYDDFIFGLKTNQALHERQEQMYNQKLTALQAAYDENHKRLLMVAERAGVLPVLTAELQQIESNKNGSQPALIGANRG